MKLKNIIIALALFSSVLTFAQDNEALKLPSKAQTFLAEYFAKQQVISVVENDKDSKKGFKAILTDNTEVQFWKNGSWREVNGHGNEIPTMFVVQPILEYVSKNYSSQKITQIEYSLGKIEIELNNKIKIEFDKEANFVKVI